MYSEFVGDDPRKVPMQIYPSVHYSMGGIWVDVKHNTNIPGLMASGECDYQYHGANRLGANSLLSATYSGTVSGPEAMRWAKEGERGSELTDEDLAKAAKECQAEYEAILKMDGSENAHELHHELGDVMNKYVTIERVNKDLDYCFDEVKKILKRWDNIGLTDKGNWANQESMFTRQLRNMIIYALVVTKAARMRDESRGAHYKREYPTRNDERFMKITVAEYDQATEEPQITYSDFDHSLVEPRDRNYAVAKKE
jgi:succinate dehydrogenase / fumarate reductase flavoprotein subunit